MKVKLLQSFVRILISAALLIYVWKNSHWSVAAFITLTTIRFEIEDFFASLK